MRGYVTGNLKAVYKIGILVLKMTVI
jgi:hypothetical protein